MCVLYIICNIICNIIYVIYIVYIHIHIYNKMISFLMFITEVRGWGLQTHVARMKSLREGGKGGNVVEDGRRISCVAP